ncbi:hypothetical protein BT96DRAFT_261905 [Gymnopus androsaceus JB14]|uniref:F-box domain-containing protein n=1 Tax=Gymnopus androsaceus JB14 TaxID=1447944 RepID=A0A6A4H3U5_9AGAR|nr:hypothetical protein BT96DRAFT_261905 [Gymnopus androsaceus JB14]
MAKLSDLPEELISQICDETELDSLIPLAESCSLLNRIAGYHYCLRTSTYEIESLGVSNRHSPIDHISFSTLYKLTSICGSMAKVTHIRCAFSQSVETLLQEMRLITLALQLTRCHLYSIRLTFDGPEKGPQACPLSSFSGAFEDLIRQVQRTQCPHFEIEGTIPLMDGPLNFDLPTNHFLISFTVGRSFVLSHPQWVLSFLNSSPNISLLSAFCSHKWTQILPHLHLPSLNDITFFGDESFINNRLGFHATTKTMNIEVLAQFADRHCHTLETIYCGTQFRVFPASPNCSFQLPHLTCLKGTISQLCYFVSSPRALCNLQSIKISTSSSRNEDERLWDLLALICTRSKVQKLFLPVNIGALRGNLLSRNMSSLRSRCPHILSLELSEFRHVTEAENGDFLRWASQVFPSTKQLEVSYMKWDSKKSSAFARAMTVEWPSVETLAIDWDEKHVQAWCRI